MHIDMRTALIMVALSELLYGILLGVVWSVRRREPSLAYWCAASLSTAAGATLYCLRGQIPDLLSIAVGNLFVILTWTLRWVGLRCFDGLRVQAWQYLALPLSVFVLYSFREPLGLNTEYRTIISCFSGIPIMTMMIVGTRRANKDEPLSTRHALIASCVLAIIIELAQIASAVQPRANANLDFMSYRGWYPVAMLVFFSTYALVNLASFMMLFERHENRLVIAATLDTLTSLLNRAGFKQLAERQLQRSAIDRESLSVLVMDLDHFKRINDEYGHDAGDAVLCAFAQCARSALRPSDLLCRPGGEEFWALLPQSDLEEARRVAQRICDQFRSLQVVSANRSISATVSIGVAQVAATESLSAVLARGDAALYRAKQAGRNRVDAEFNRFQTVASGLSP